MSFAAGVAPDTTEIPRGALGVWALGQSGFLLKNSRGKVIAVDPCLADPVGRRDDGWHRLYPPPLAPEHLHCDVLLATHDHLDHLDPDTISALTPDAVGLFAGPGNACRHFLDLGVDAGRILRLDASHTVDLDGLQLVGTLAVTNDPEQPDAEGVIIRLEGAPSVYHSGDTSFSPLLSRVRNAAPDVFMPCINGRYGNMDCLEAALLGAALRCRWAIPHHYDMFRENLADPERFKTDLGRLAPETECVTLRPGQMCVLAAEVDR
jgi:L-ascorbate 6-phosphate lactonase